MDGLRKAGVEKTIWVWTPPASDSLAAYYPGIASVDWLCVDGTPVTGGKRPTATYASFRHQVATRAEFHQTPVMVILPPAADEMPASQIERLTERYPEIKAVVFGKKLPNTTAPLEQKASLSRPTRVDKRLASVRVTPF